MGKEILKGVAIAVLVAAILGIASKVSGTVIIKWLGGVTHEEFAAFKAKAIQDQDKIAVRTLQGYYWSIPQVGDVKAATFGLSTRVANNPTSYEQFFVERQGNKEGGSN